MVKVRITTALLCFALSMTQLTSADKWFTPEPVQSLFLKTTLEAMVVFIPELDSEPELSSDEATKLAMSVFKGYGVWDKFYEYSSGAITMKGVGADPIITVKHIKKGAGTCDRGKIIDTVKETISPIEPDRLIIVSSIRNATCPGAADTDFAGKISMVYNLGYFNPDVMFHELGHDLTFPHPGSSLCYANHKEVTMSDNCTSTDGELFQSMWFILHDAPWFKEDGITNADGAINGIMEYSSYNRLTSTYPMLNETNVLDFTGSGTYQIYNSETSSIGDNTATVRIPLNPPIKISNDTMITKGISYHTHYYIDFSQRRPNTDEGGYYNYIVIRSGTDHRGKASIATRFMTALSTNDTSFSTSFHDNMRDIKVTINSMDDDGAFVDISAPSDYVPSEKVNNCYFSSVVNSTYAVSVNGNQVCRAIGMNDLPTIGSYNGTGCLTSYLNAGYVTAPPDVEYLHCTGTSEWISANSSVMDNGFDIFGESSNYVCRTTFEEVEYGGRGDMEACCFYHNDGDRCAQNDTSTLYLKWLSL